MCHLTHTTTLTQRTVFVLEITSQHALNLRNMPRHPYGYVFSPILHEPSNCIVMAVISDASAAYARLLSGSTSGSAGITSEDLSYVFFTIRVHWLQDEQLKGSAFDFQQRVDYYVNQ